jgi:excisionase family DNA binding protein
MKKLMTVEDLAEALQVSVSTIYAWRYHGQGPRGLRVGGAVRFDPDEVAAWLRTRADRRAG